MTALRIETTPAETPAPTLVAAFPELTRDEVFMIGTRRLWLRWPRFDDAEALARIGGDVRVAPNTGTWPLGCDAGFARERISKSRLGNAAGTGFNFVIARREAWGEAIGLIGFNIVADADELTAIGGYHLDPEHWGQGYASEAIASLVSMIRLLTRVRVLQAGVMPHNTAPARVLEKSGFETSGFSTMTTEARGTFPLVHYRRRLNGVAGTTPTPKPMT
jgi:RimJ/RimL family protein N-acetyltransferase